MKPGDVLKKQFLAVVANQLRDNEPPETRQTLERLQAEGYSEEESKLLIAQCVAAEIQQVMRSNQPFNNERYVKWLDQLPESPE